MEQVVIEAERREEFGSGPARRLREQGIVPGVVYGMGKETLPISVSAGTCRSRTSRLRREPLRLSRTFSAIPLAVTR